VTALWHDGTTQLVFEPIELLEKLAAIPRGVCVEKASSSRAADQADAGRAVARAGISENIPPRIACRKLATKAHVPLDREEMARLLADLALADTPYFCPHGRPIE
jgi:DNA mismatch repair ATPase MutL